MRWILFLISEKTIKQEYLKKEKLIKVMNELWI